MAIRIYRDKIRFVADSDNDTDIDLLIESDGLKFTGTLTTAFNVPYANGPPQLPQPPPNAQGEIAGFYSGGSDPGNIRVSTIQKFPISISSGTTTDVGNIFDEDEDFASASSDTEGFHIGGTIFHPLSRRQMGKFPFAISSGTGTFIGTLAIGVYTNAGHQSTTDGFSSGGFDYNTLIEKFPFAISSGTAADVGDLTVGRRYVAGHSSSTDGFTSSGQGNPGPVQVPVIDKFPFAISGGTATDVGDLVRGKYTATGHSSSTDGFNTGGDVFSASAQIVKFPFAISGGTGTDVGDLSTGQRDELAGATSITDAFSGGGDISNTRTNIHDKFPFAISSGTATDVGDLTVAIKALRGHQD